DGAFPCISPENDVRRRLASSGADLSPLGLAQRRIRVGAEIFVNRANGIISPVCELIDFGRGHYARWNFAKLLIKRLSFAATPGFKHHWNSAALQIQPSAKPVDDIKLL